MVTRTSVANVLRSPWTLAAAALLVGIAIVWDGVGARAFNGIGGIVWVACAVALAVSLRRGGHWATPGGVVVALAVCFAVVVRPSDGLIAVVAFGLGGAAVAYTAQTMEIAWSVFLPALWLPVHLGVAISKASYRALTDGEATVRTDPPPTAAVVPLLMVLAAWAGGLFVSRFVKRRLVERETQMSRA